MSRPLTRRAAITGIAATAAAGGAVTMAAANQTPLERIERLTSELRAAVEAHDPTIVEWTEKSNLGMAGDQEKSCNFLLIGFNY